MLASVLEEETNEAIRLRNRIVIEIHAASYRSTRGYTVIAALLDEIAIWESDETSAEPHVEIINAIRPGMATIPGAMLLCASSPHARRGALWEAHRKHFGQDGDPVLVWQAATRAMNPAVPQSFIDRHMADDPARARAEYFAEFRADVETFISREVVDASVVPGRHELPRIAGARYTGFVDPSGGSSDSMTLAIAHVESDTTGTNRAVVDLIREVKPPFSPDAVVAEFATLLKAYGVLAVRGDRYGGAWPRERFCVYGIDYQPAAKTTSDLYIELLPVLNSNRAELLDHTRLITQLCQLERHAGSGKDSIRHPPGGHDDVINAAAGAIVMALNVASQEVTSFSMPVVAGGTPRSVAGGSSLGYADVFAAPTPNALRPSTDEPKQVSADAQREANRQRVNNDKSAYTQQGLRPAGGEPWRPFVGGSNDGFYWGGRGGRNW